MRPPGTGTPSPWRRPGHLPAPRAVPGMSGLRCTGVLYQGGVSGSSLRTVWCKAAHFGAWPRASVGLGNASFPATPSAPHPHPARHGHAAPRGNGHRAPAGLGTGHPSPRRGDGTATQPSWGTWELNARAGGSVGDAEPGVWFIEGTHPQVMLVSWRWPPPAAITRCWRWS